MNIDQLYIFSIVIDETFEYKVTEVEQVKYIEMGLVYFINNYLGNPNNTEFWKYNKDTLYILRDSNYSDVNKLFSRVKDVNMSVTRGTSQKAHMVSPIDFRLSCYLMILCDMNYKKFCAENSFNVISKDRYLPSR